MLLMRESFYLKFTPLGFNMGFLTLFILNGFSFRFKLGKISPKVLLKFNSSYKFQNYKCLKCFTQLNLTFLYFLFHHLNEER